MVKRKITTHTIFNNHTYIQKIDGYRDVTPVTSLKIEAFFSVQPARDANVNSNVKLLDQHHKLVEQNRVVMLILFNSL